MTARGLRSKLLVVLVTCSPLAFGCAKSVSYGGEAAACANPVETTRHELLFGQMLPDSTIVEDQEFDDFVNDVVSPLFPEGFTIIHAAGRYQLADGTKIEEPSKVLLLIYPDDTDVREKIRVIIAQYRSRFRQESVGWVRTTARVCF